MFFIVCGGGGGGGWGGGVGVGCSLLRLKYIHVISCGLKSVRGTKILR